MEPPDRNVSLRIQLDDRSNESDGFTVTIALAEPAASGGVHVIRTGFA